MSLKLGNPALFECKKSVTTLHFWHRWADGRAACGHCGQIVSKEHADEIFRDSSK